MSIVPSRAIVLPHRHSKAPSGKGQKTGESSRYHIGGIGSIFRGREYMAPRRRICRGGQFQYSISRLFSHLSHEDATRRVFMREPVNTLFELKL